jgi:hypothetical protein
MKLNQVFTIKTKRIKRSLTYSTYSEDTNTPIEVISLNKYEGIKAYYLKQKSISKNCVYMIEEETSNSCYIGSTTNIKFRMATHLLTIEDCIKNSTKGKIQHFHKQLANIYKTNKDLSITVHILESNIPIDLLLKTEFKYISKYCDNKSFEVLNKYIPQNK